MTNFVKGVQNMYEVFEQLLQKYGVTAYKVGKATGIASSTFTDWKNGRSIPKQDKLLKIANFFGVSSDYLMTGKEPEEKESMITPKDERDIAKKLDKIMVDIDNNNDAPLYYNGEEIDEMSKTLLRAAIESAMRQMKIINKEKHNPNKNKK